jgi:hypothetical protein
MFANEVWLTPLILLPGVALLIVSTINRFGQVSTEFHEVAEQPDSKGKILTRRLVRRASRLRNALLSLYSSVGLLSFGSLLGGVVNLWRPESLWVVGGLTLLGIIFIVYASAQLFAESRLCLQSIEEHMGERVVEETRF